MRIIILTVFFVAGFYYFRSEDKPQQVVETEISKPAPGDTIRIHAAAPNRESTERMLTVEEEPAASESAVSAEAPTENTREVNAVVEELEQVEEVPWTELDQDWNNELKDYLGRLEPYESETIHKAYLSEIDSFKAEMEALLNEKQSKATEEEAQEVEQLINQLDYKHEENLKEIFGAHYDAIRDHYNFFMENSPGYSE